MRMAPHARIPEAWVAQAASLLFAAACREHSGDVPAANEGGLSTTRRRVPPGWQPAGAGWQPALPRRLQTHH